jgi:hypothetical protein
VATETISRKEAVAWLAGIMDGEGCVHAFWAKQMPHMTGPGMRVNVLIGGCHPELIARVTQVLKAVEVGFNLQAFTPSGGRKPAAQVVIAGKGRVKKLLLLLMPYLTEKRHQAKLALELIAYREGLAGNLIYGKSREGKIGLHNDPVIVEGIAKIKAAKQDVPNMLQFSRQSNQVLGSQSSETLRRLLRIDEVMIKSEPDSDARSAAEMTAPVL